MEFEELLALARICQVQIWEERKQKVVAELRCRNEVKGVCLHRVSRFSRHCFHPIV